MFRNYFVTAFRNLWKNKFYSAINITGLSVGLAVGIMILLWVRDEVSFDGFHHNAKNIYKINSHLGSGIGEQVWEGAPSPIALFAKSDIPEVENAVRVAPNYSMSLYANGNSRFVISNTAFTDKSFFSVFDFRFIEGDAKTPFRDANSVILTESTAKKFFGNSDPMGKIIVADNNENFTVSGVLEDFPENSTISYAMLFPIENYAKKFGGNGPWKTIDEDLGNYFYSIYLQLKPNSNVTTVETKVTKIFNDKHPGGTRYTMQNIKDLHLYGADGNPSAMQTVRTFTIVAILILFIACINYVNLSTARSMLRSKEVSVRKIIGAQRAQLFLQFVFESAAIFAIGSIVAVLLIKLLFPFYNQISGKNLVFSFTDMKMWMVILLSITGSLVIASLYPALLLSSFKPIEALKGKLSFGGGNAQFRKILVVTQFVFSIALIIATIVITLQLKYIREKNLGYDKEHVFSFNIRQNMYDHFAAVKEQLLKRPGVLGITASEASIVGVNSTTGDTWWEGKPDNSTFLIHPAGVDENYIPLFKMNLAAGKNFTGEKSDSAHFILNETAVKEAGLKDPIGKPFQVWQTKGSIIGVVKDFNYASLKQRIEPTVFLYHPANWRMFVKTNGKDAAKAVAAVQDIWSNYIPDYPFSYSFVDEDYDALYKSEQRTGMLFNVFAFVAILISCLGLFGLAAYTAQVKTKEIGIRKVLGATVANIVQLLAKDFVSLELFPWSSLFLLAGGQ